MQFLLFVSPQHFTSSAMDCLFFIMQDEDDGGRLNFHAVSIAGMIGLFST
jgi:hypothetical protein